MRPLDIVGKRFGMLVVIEKMPNKNNKSVFKCKCDCGQEKTHYGCEINYGNYKSCGCNRTPQTTKKYREHPLYDVWKGMKARCNDKRHQSYSRYGGKGVKVCQKWSSYFTMFYSWCLSNNWQEGLQIDKDLIPKKLGIPALLYSPEMCTIVTRLENMRANSHTKLDKIKATQIFNSKEATVKLASLYKVSTSTIYRIKNKEIWVN